MLRYKIINKINNSGVCYVCLWPNRACQPIGHVRLYGSRCPLSPERRLNIITHSLTDNRACHTGTIAGATIMITCDIMKSLKIFEDQAPVDKVYGFQIFKWVPVTWLKKVGHQDSSARSNHQGDMANWNEFCPTIYHRSLNSLCLAISDFFYRSLLFGQSAQLFVMNSLH